ncbi:MAG: hypothetical protein LBF43_01225 [Puniceicoccales bacterium]|jgi:hypothetical protein|nr:hypothetical protein [Puniceicoccales bacterium]
MFTVYEFNCDNAETISCVCDEENNKYWVQYHEKLYDNFSALLKQAQSLLKPENLPIYCQVINFIHTGIDFSWIQDIEAYRSSYADWMKTVGTEHVHPCANFGPFDLSEIQPPHISGDKLIFYMQDNYTKVPYRVESQYPLRDPKGEIFYNLLPYLKTSDE